MTIPTTYEAVLILGLVFVPGFLFLVFARRSNLVATDNLEAKDYFWMLVIGACIHFVALFIPFGTQRLIRWYENGMIDQHMSYFAGWALMVCVVAPILLGALSGPIVSWEPIDAILDRVGLGFVDRLPSAWDYANWQFRSDAPEGGWMVVYLTDGQVIGGMAGSVATSRHVQDLFLSEAWNLDPELNFTSPKPDNIGVWVRHDQIQRIEYYQSWEDDDHAQVAIPELRTTAETADQAVDRDRDPGVRAEAVAEAAETEPSATAAPAGAAEGRGTA